MIVLSLFGAQSGRPAAQTQARPTAVAIFYDGPEAKLAEGFLDARQIQNLLGHFGLTGEIIPVASYKPGSLAEYRAAFFIGATTGTKFPPLFLEDVRNSTKPFCWLGRHIGKLLESAGGKQQFGFDFVDYRDDLEFREVQYKGTTLPKEDPDLNIVTVLDTAAVEVRATARNDAKVSYPYALHRNNFWYFADSPFSYAEESGRYLVFCDLLHDILDMNHPASSRALVRIEDVSTEIDPGDLRAIADLLARRKVPFQFGVIPIYRKPSQGIEVRLTDRPYLLDALHYMVARGGTPVLHGVTHQYRGVTGDDFEFWNGIDNKAIVGDSADFVLRRLELGLAECFAAGIFPVAFETPHYGASDTDYEAMKRVFPLFYERVMATPDIQATQYFPYAGTDRLGRSVAPEDLAYLPVDRPDPKVLIARAKNLRVVRDGVASFYFHPFLDPALLDEVLRGVSDLGYRFVSLREFGGGANFAGHYVVAAASGTYQVSPANEFWRMRVYDRAGKLVRDESSPERHSGPVDVKATIPAGGWAALECVRNAPRKASAPSWGEQARQWWARIRYGQRSPEATGFPSTGEAWVLWLDGADTPANNNQESYRALLEASGYQVKLVRATEFTQAPADYETILVVPESVGARLNEQQAGTILEYVAKGGALVADGRQKWLEELGFHWSDHRIPVSTVVDVLFPEMQLHWQPQEGVERFTPPEGARQLMIDPESRQVLAIGGDYGAGHYLHLAAPLDAHTPFATSRYPYLMEYLGEVFRHRSKVRSARLEVYFDPGFRQGVDLERLAALWRQNGVHTIYAAAWQFYPHYSYDYTRLLRVAHQNGISVYAWFVLPEVTPKMWEEHPEWRERTATGADGNVGWRLPMNLQNPACFRAAMGWMKDLLTSYDWDGVNITELNFDADFVDYLRPERFVPMNDEVRAEFHGMSGFDPKLIFTPGSAYYHKRNPEALEKFLRYREDVVTEWHRRVLRELAPMEKERGWEVIVTMLDSLHSNYVRPALGVNSHRLVELMKEFDFTLQVEDPAEYWTKPPDRYRAFAQTYLPLVPDRRRLMFDVNVMPNRDVAGTSLPSGLMTGTELATTVMAAAGPSGRVAVYSEFTVPTQDWALMGQALSSSARLHGGRQRWDISAPAPVRLLAAEDRNYYMDGQLWPVSSAEGVLVPPGRHRLSIERPWYRFLERGEMPTRLLYANAELLAARSAPTSLTLRYSSPSRAVFLLNQLPMSILVDGRASTLTARAGGANWWVAAPRGEHRIEIVTTTQAGVVVNAWGWLSSSLITTFGAVTTFLMAAIYLYVRVKRLARGGTS